MPKILNNQKKKTGVYKITAPDNSIYIGGTMNLQTRCWYYQSMDCQGQKRLYASILKHGWGSHKVEMLHELPKDIKREVLDTYEELYIKQHQCNYSDFPEFNGLNMTNGKRSLSPNAAKRLLEKRSMGIVGLCGSKRGKHGNARKVINIQTNEIYDCIIDAADSLNMKAGVLSGHLRRGRHYTPMRYLD